MEGLSTWYLRLSRRRFSRSDDPRDQDAAFATLHASLAATSQMLAPLLPFLADTIYGNLVAAVDASAPDSVHLTTWPAADLAGHRDEALETSMAVAQGAVDLAGPCAPPRISGRASRWRRPGSRSRSVGWRSAASCCGSSPTRSTSRP